MRLFTIFFIITVLASCKSQNGAINNYLRNVDTAGTTLLRLPEPVIQKSDLLSIKVYSLSADPRTDLPYNLPEATAAGGTSANGFLVDNEGNIEYPRIGVFHVEGLTKNALAQLIKQRLDTILKSPSVIVRFLNFRVTVLGEVRSPGSFNVPTERVTLLEALGLAGDISDYGNKSVVRIAREKDGRLELGFVDLTSQDLFTSPYFRLQQNDVVFVEQNRRKLQQEERQNIAQQIQIATSIIATIAIILNIIR
jgi:polysaccharide export outer membrane protein